MNNFIGYTLKWYQPDRSRNLKILLYKWKVFNQQDIKSALERAGHTVDFFQSVKFEREREREIVNKLAEVFSEYDLIFSVNYFQEVSKACMAAGKKYISWTVDSPMLTMYHKSVYNPCNYIFIFDKFSFCRFKALGLKHVYYMPLAADARRLETLLETSDKAERERFSGEISFVGGLYDKNSYDDVRDKLTPYLRGYFDAAFQAQMDLFGENIFDRLLTVDVLAELSECVELKQDEDSMSDLKLVFTNTFLGYKMAQLERIECLNRLARTAQVNLFTDDPVNGRLFGVRLRGTVSYLYDMPKVFANSKINMNFTIRNIRSGLPLRIWDVLGAGGFLLTNFQPEILSFFENGKDLVYYESLDDMCKKARYYLEHEDERRQIAKSGHEKVKKYHSYDARIKEILRLAEVE